MRGIKHVCQTRFRHIFNFMFSRRFSLRIRLKYFKTKLILKVITSICNEAIFHLIVKSTLAKLCGVRIINDTLNRKFNCLGAYDIFKAVTSYRGECFQVPTHLTTVTRQTGKYKVDLTRHPNFHSPLSSWQAVVSHTDFNLSSVLTCLWSIQSV